MSAAFQRLIVVSRRHMFSNPAPDIYIVHPLLGPEHVRGYSNDQSNASTTLRKLKLTLI